MSSTICTEHTNELILVEDVLDPAGSAVVALGLLNQDGSDTFPGRTLTPEQAEELAASLGVAAAAARARAGSAQADATTSRSDVPASSRPAQLDELPIAEYDQLGAAVIIKQLAGLSASQLTAVLGYEQSHRNRKTICDRIAARQAALSRAGAST